MTWNLIFWFYAYGLTFVALFLAYTGVAAVRKGDLARHRALLNMACSLIIFFVISYVFKMVFLGREDKSEWDVIYKIVLYIHEALIATMLVTGAWARWLAFKFRDSLFAQQLPTEHEAMRQKHRTLGLWCIYSATLALLTASVILYGMVQRGG